MKTPAMCHLNWTNGFRGYVCGLIRYFSGQRKNSVQISVINFNFYFKNFLLPTDIEPEHISAMDNIKLSLTSIHDKSPVVIWFSDKDETKIITENMDLAGDLIHSLANFLNIEDLKVEPLTKYKFGQFQ